MELINYDFENAKVILKICPNISVEGELFLIYILITQLI